jgi:hypothetical protein
MLNSIPLAQLGIKPTKSHAEGWYNAEEGIGTIGLLYRDATVTSVEDWPESERNEECPLLDITFSPTHTLYQLSGKANSKRQELIVSPSLPVNGFHCELNKHSTKQLGSLGVEGIVKLDPTDKMSRGLARILTGDLSSTSELFYQQEMVPVNLLLLSGKTLPEEIYSLK